MHLIENYHMNMVPSCSANLFGSGKDKNEDEQKDFTGLQYFKILVGILQSHVLFAILLVLLQ